MRPYFTIRFNTGYSSHYLSCQHILTVILPECEIGLPVSGRTFLIMALSTVKQILRRAKRLIDTKSYTFPVHATGLLIWLYMLSRAERSAIRLKIHLNQRITINQMSAVQVLKKADFSDVACP